MNPPSEFLCPISLDTMRDPVLCEDGHTYERASISQWLAANPTSPTTRQPMSLANIRPNYALRTAIDRWYRQVSQSQQQSYITIPIAPPLTTPLLIHTNTVTNNPISQTTRRSRIKHCHPIPLFLYAVIIAVFIFMWHEGMFG